MAPKNSDPTEKPNQKDEDDLLEMEAVNNKLDELSTALDSFEQRTNSILEQLRELLQSNREFRKEIAEVNGPKGIKDNAVNKTE